MKRVTETRRGFTLVEAIMIAVIIAVLAAVAIPVYRGYVTNARQEAVDNLAATTAAAANVYVRRRGTGGLTVAALDVFFDNTRHTVTMNVANRTVTVTDVTDNTITRTTGF